MKLKGSNMKLCRQSLVGTPSQTSESIKKKAKKIVTTTVGVCIIASSFLTGFNLHNTYESNQIEQEYCQTIKDYNMIVENTTSFLKQLGVDNPDDVYYATTLLIHHGFFSINDCFDYDSECAHFDIDGYTGVDIIKGYGTCRHEAELLNRILNNYGYESYLVLNHSSLIEEEDSSLNHVVVICNTDDGYRVYDPTNFEMGMTKDGLTIYYDGYKTKLNLYKTFLLKYTDLKQTIGLVSMLVSDDFTKNEDVLYLKNAEKFDDLYDEYRNINYPYMERIMDSNDGWNINSK